MTARNAAILVLPLVLLASCSSFNDWRMQRSIERGRAQALKKIDIAECEHDGGHVQGVGMFATPACVKPFPDAGKACSDDSECTGACVAPDDAVVGKHATGICQVDTAALFGCHNLVKSGIAVAGMCMD